MKRHLATRYALSLAIAAALPFAVHAQDAPASQEPAPPAQDSESADATTLDTVVVSGTARFKGLRKRDASFSITTATPEQIEEANPASTADLLKIVPGVWAESSGGQTGANVFVRGLPADGDAPFLTLQLDGSPLYPPPTLSFLENSSLFRIDDTVARVEVLRGGPSPIFSNGQPGATVNFIQKKGEDEPEGSVRLTLGIGSLRRVDAYHGGRLADGWYYSVGGFYRDSDGLRDTQFPADKGGQISGTLSRRWDTGEFTVYARHTDDNNAFYTAVPLQVNASGDISAFPGFDPGSDTLIGNDFRNVTLPVGPNGAVIQRDMARGRGVDINLVGASLDWEAGGWTISDRINHLSGDAPTYALFTGGNPQTLASFIAGYGTTGTGSFVNGGGAVDPNQQVLVAGWWSVDKKLSSLTNDLRFSKELFEGNTLTIGNYFADYSSKDTWYLGNNMLLTATPNARRINLSLANGQVATRDGFVGTSFYNIRGDYDGRNVAFFIADEWQINERLRLDAGFRHEKQEINGVVVQPVSVDLDQNQNTLYDNFTSIATNPVRIDQDDSHSAWTIGANYTLNDDVSLFARANSGFKFPQFDNLRDGVRNVQEIDQYEVGLKAGNAAYDLYLTAFFNDFTGLPFQQITSTGDIIAVTGDSRTRGLEFEGAVRAGNFELGWSGVWMDAEYTKFGTLDGAGNFIDYKGNMVARQPKLQFRLMPSYYWSLPYGDLKVYGTYSNIGKRYSDPQNLQRLPGYDKVDLGARLGVGDHWEFAVNASNLTNALGLTEGNARVVGSGASNGVFMGRPIEGRSVEVSALFKF